MDFQVIIQEISYFKRLENTGKKESNSLKLAIFQVFNVWLGKMWAEGCIIFIMPGKLVRINISYNMSYLR